MLVLSLTSNKNDSSHILENQKLVESIVITTQQKYLFERISRNIFSNISWYFLSLKITCASSINRTYLIARQLFSVGVLAIFMKTL